MKPDLFIDIISKPIEGEDELDQDSPMYLIEKGDFAKAAELILEAWPYSRGESRGALHSMLAFLIRQRAIARSGPDGISGEEQAQITEHVQAAEKLMTMQQIGE